MAKLQHDLVGWDRGFGVLYMLARLGLIQRDTEIASTVVLLEYFYWKRGSKR